jgi:hypothetical protein
VNELQTAFEWNLSEAAKALEENPGHDARVEELWEEFKHTIEDVDKKLHNLGYDGKRAEEEMLLMD